MAWFAFTLLSLGLAANVSLICYFLVHDFKWKNIHILTFNLAISDLLQVISTAIATAMKRILKTDIEFLMEMSAHWFISVSIFHIILLAAERLIAVRAPFWAKVNLTKRRTIIASVLVWVGQAITHIAAILLLIYCTSQNDWEGRVYEAMYIFSWSSLVMSIGIFVLYSYIKYLLLKQIKRHRRSLRKEMSTFIYCTAIALAFVITFCPFDIAMISYGYGSKRFPETETIFVLMNNIFNPLLFLAKELVDRKQKQKPRLTEADRE